MVTTLDIGIVGLGKMGANIALNLTDHEHQVMGFDSNQDMQARMHEKGIQTVSSLEQLIQQLPCPRVVWVMVPSGKPTKTCLTQLCDLLDENDILIDAGNSFYRDSIRHAEQARNARIRFLDIGTSGGISGARNGACLMIGGDASAYEHIRPLLEDISVDEGCLYTGAPGSGHFMKMVHNGIEYGMMQAIAEGIELMHESPYDYDLSAVAHNWNHGSVIRSWLIELMEQQLISHPNLADIKGIVAMSGEATWTVQTALEMEVPTPVISLALMVRTLSQKPDSFSAKAVSALRNGFGGHAMVMEPERDADE